MSLPEPDPFVQMIHQHTETVDTIGRRRGLIACVRFLRLAGHVKAADLLLDHEEVIVKEKRK